ncbi:MAG: D-mannonate epimerase, partial [Planctomycetota bacterium]|nr:D-mannonate epimerase [Planctomycetota bacterium]
RKYGYVGRDNVLRMLKEYPDLAENLSVAAHLIHASSDERFNITYAPGHLTKEETEAVNFRYMPLADALAKYDVTTLQPGFNMVDGEEIYFVPNPALGLWADRNRFENAGPGSKG